MNTQNSVLWSIKYLFNCYSFSVKCIKTADMTSVLQQLILPVSQRASTHRLGQDGIKQLSLILWQLYLIRPSDCLSLYLNCLKFEGISQYSSLTNVQPTLACSWPVIFLYCHKKPSHANYLAHSATFFYETKYTCLWTQFTHWLNLSFTLKS